MNGCSNLFVLSSIACQLSECLSEEELTVFAADILALSDMISSILARRSACKELEASDEK